MLACNSTCAVCHGPGNFFVAIYSANNQQLFCVIPSSENNHHTFPTDSVLILLDCFAVVLLLDFVPPIRTSSRNLESNFLKIYLELGKGFLLDRTLAQVKGLKFEAQWFL